MPHGYSRLGGAPVEELPRRRRPLSIRGFFQACLEGGIRVYADLRDAVAWLQGVAVIRGDTADECAGVDFGEQEYLAVLEFLQRMSNVVINDGGTGLFARLQAGTLLHADKYVFVTEASQPGFWSIGQVFSRYRNYEGEKERPLTEQEMKHLNGLIDAATVVVDKFAESDPEQVLWLAQIRERVLRGRECRWWRPPGISRSPTASRWILALWRARRSMPSWRWPTWCCMAPTGLTAGIRASLRRRQKTPFFGDGQQGPAESPALAPRSLCHQLLAWTAPTLSPDTPGVRIVAVPPAADSPAAGPVTAAAPPDTPDAGPDAPARAAHSRPNEPLIARPPVRSTAAAAPDTPDGWPDTPNVRIIAVRTESDSTDTEPTVLQTVTAESGTLLRRPKTPYSSPMKAIRPTVYPVRSG